MNDWYKNLKKAPWSPPGYVFGIVWPILYILFGIINLRIINSNHNPASKTFYVMNTLLESIILNLWVVHFKSVIRINLTFKLKKLSGMLPQMINRVTRFLLKDILN